VRVERSREWKMSDGLRVFFTFPSPDFIGKVWDEFFIISPCGIVIIKESFGATN